MFHYLNILLLLAYILGFLITFYKILPDAYFVSKGVDSRLDALFAVFVALYFSLFWIFGLIGIYLLNPMCKKIINLVINKE